jgi:flagellar basal body-associated protein FliL
VKLTELEQGARSGGFDTKGSGFSKKDNKVNQIFIIIGVVLGLVILALLIYIASTIKK